MRCCTGEFLQLVELVTGQRRDHFEVARNVRDVKEHFKNTVGVTGIFLKINFVNLQDYIQCFFGRTKLILYIYTVFTYTSIITYISEYGI
jgi:hypothetical protein